MMQINGPVNRAIMNTCITNSEIFEWHMLLHDVISVGIVVAMVADEVGELPVLFTQAP